MRELYQLVVKTMENSEKLEIFFSVNSSSILTGNPLQSFGRGEYMGSYKGTLEQYSYFDFTFKYHDGNPDVRVKYSKITTSETKEETFKEGTWWNRAINKKNVPIKAHPIYEITAGELSYITTVEEAKKLHVAYKELVKRDKEARVNIQRQQILDRLDGKVELKTKKK